MAFIRKKTVKNNEYLYLEKSIRIQGNVHKYSKYLGRPQDITEEQKKQSLKEFTLNIDEKLVKSVTQKRLKHITFSHPFDKETVYPLEEMNLKYQSLKRSLHKKDFEDVIRRFVANFVFESNALEGNSLTLKNISEIVFESKIHESADLREVFDAKNAYHAFTNLLTKQEAISEEFIIQLHKQLLKDIDERTGYRKLPSELLGRTLALPKPEDIPKEMKQLLQWHHKHEHALHPVELAFKFHHKFEQIHPFADGNGRVGRMLLNYILLQNNFFPIIIRKTQRNAYLRALEAADTGQYIPLMRFAIARTKDTYRKFFETYYQYS